MKNKIHTILLLFILVALARLFGYSVTGSTLSDVASGLRNPAATATLEFDLNGYTIKYSDYTGSGSTHNCCTTATASGATLSYSGVISSMPEWTDIGSQNCSHRNAEWSRFRERLDTHENKHISIGQDVYDEYHESVESAFEGHTEDACAASTSVARLDAEYFIEVAAAKELSKVVNESVKRNNTFDKNDRHATLRVSQDIFCD